nr:ORF3 [Torque teno felis virus]
MMEWFPRQEAQPILLKPKAIIKKGQDTQMISGPKTSTQTASSQTELLKELLDLITSISDEKWKTRHTLDDLNISLTSSDTSSSSEDSSSDSSSRSPPPYPPPHGGALLHRRSPRPPTPKKKKKSYIM